MHSKRKRKTPLCVICGGLLQKTAIAHEEKRGTRIYLFENVPAQVCRTCGEVWIAGTTLKEMDRLILEGEPVRKVATPVYDFALTVAK